MASAYYGDVPRDLQELLRKVFFSEKGDKCFSQEKKGNFLFLSPAFPRFDIASSAFRVSKLLEVFSKRAEHVYYIYFHKPKGFFPEDWISKYPDNVHFIYIPPKVSSILSFISSLKVEVFWFTDFWREIDIQFLMQIALDLKLSMDSQLVIDSVDFHCKKYFRKYKEQGNGEDLYRARHFFSLAKSFYSLADSVTVVSSEEKREIEKNIPYVKNVEVIPNIYSLCIPEKKFSQRKDLCFVGNFGVNQNIDAVDYFLGKIFPHIRQKSPEVEFHIIGSGSEDFRCKWEGAGVRVLGYVEDLRKVLENYRVFVCPMTYGAGLKGKIGSALEAGLPFVSTGIGIEGYPVLDGRECFIEDDPKCFAEKCLELLRDQKLWYCFSVKSMVMASENYSLDSVSENLYALLKRPNNFPEGSLFGSWGEKRERSIAFLGKDLSEISEDETSFDFIIIIRILLANNFRIYFIQEEEKRDLEIFRDLEAEGVNFLCLPLDLSVLQEWFRENRVEILWMTALPRERQVQLFANLILLIKEEEMVESLILDLRLSGKEKTKASFSFEKSAIFRAANKTLLSFASTALVASLSERGKLREKIGSKVEILPLISGYMWKLFLEKEEVLDSKVYARVGGNRLIQGISDLLKQIFNPIEQEEKRKQKKHLNQKLLQGERLLKDWDYDGASENFKGVLQETEIAQRVFDLLERWELNELEEFLNKSLSAHIFAYCGLAVGEYVEGDKRLALEYLNKAADILPFDPLVQKNVAKIYEDLGILGLKEAVKAYQFVLEKSPSDLDALLGLANVFSKLGSLEMVLHFYEKACLNPPETQQRWKQQRELIENVRSVWREKLGLSEIFSLKETREDREEIAASLHERLKGKNWEERLPIYQKIFLFAEYLHVCQKPSMSLVIYASRLSANTLLGFKKLKEMREEEKIELIFVDRGERGGECSLLRPFVDTWISLKRESTSCMARNIGALYASSPIILFLYDDCLPSESCLQGHLQVYNEFDLLAARGRVESSEEKFYRMLEKDRACFLQNCVASPIDIEGNTSVLSEVFFQVGGWDDEIEYGGALELSRRLLTFDADMRKQVYCPSCLVWREKSIWEREDKEKDLQIRLELSHLTESFVEKWDRLPQLLRKPLLKKNSFQSKDLFQKSLHFLAEQREEESFKVLKKAFAEKNIDINILHALGMRYLEKKQFYEALYYLEMALDLGPFCREIVLDFSRLCHRLGLFHDALEKSYEFLCQFPDDDEVLQLILDLQRKSKKDLGHSVAVYTLHCYSDDAFFKEE